MRTKKKIMRERIPNRVKEALGEERLKAMYRDLIEKEMGGDVLFVGNTKGEQVTPDHPSITRRALLREIRAEVQKMEWTLNSRYFEANYDRLGQSLGRWTQLRRAFKQRFGE